MNYLATRKKAARAIQKAGMAMTLKRMTPGEFDPSTGSDAGGKEAAYACYGVIGAPELKGFGNVFLDGTLIEAGDIQVTLAAESLPVEPRAGDAIVVGEEEFHVVTSLPVRPGGVAIVHKVVGRR